MVVLEAKLPSNVLDPTVVLATAVLEEILPSDILVLEPAVVLEATPT